MKRFAFYAGVFVLCFTTLMIEVIETRLLSVMSWYHLAFFVISAAMFGLTGGAVWVYLRREHYAAGSIERHLSRSSASFAVAAVLSLVVQTTLAPALVLSVSAMLVFAELAMILATPFFFSGIAISLALTRGPCPVGRVYAADLTGAALGCLGVIALLDRVDAVSAIILCGMGAAAASALFALADPHARLERGPAWLRPLPLLLVLGALGTLNSLTQHGIQPIVVKSSIERRDHSLMFEKWNSFSRITVRSPGDGVKAPPHLWGRSPKLPPWRSVEYKSVTIDGSAETPLIRFSGDAREVDYLNYDVTNLVYAVRNSGRAAVIGVGGGRDVISAWIAGFRDITGVEINPILVDLLERRDRFAEYSGVSNLSGVRLVVDEARSWLARTPDRFDTIQMSMIDTWAATGAGAFTLTENGLYTLEAWTMFLNRLTPGGLFTVSRWYGAGAVNETGRMISLAMAAAFESGAARPEDHIFVAATGRVATLILSRSPLSPEDRAALSSACERYGYSVLISPGGQPASEVLGRILHSPDRVSLENYTSHLDLDLTPSTDDRPFFFNVLRLDRPHLAMRYIGGSSGVAAGNIVATLTLATILCVSALLVTATIVLPLRPAMRDSGRRLVAAGTTYFALLGMGFMMVEIGLLQRLSVFLGHPVYSLSLVLFSLILSTGAGSYFSETLRVETLSARLAAWSLLLAGYLGFLPWWLPAALARVQGAGLASRAGLALAVIMPAGVLMGLGFPAGMRLVRAIDERPTPWFWGVNGAAGVLASALAIVTSLTGGIGLTISLGAVCYLLLLPAAMALRSTGARIAMPLASGGPLSR